MRAVLFPICFVVRSAVQLGSVEVVFERRLVPSCLLLYTEAREHLAVPNAGVVSLLLNADS